MAVNHPDKVDLVSTGDGGEFVLIITDHLDWSESLEHQRMLQTKINTYLRFIETGQLVGRFPDAAGKEVVIRVVAASEPDADGRQFLDRAAQALAGAGYKFFWQRFE